MPDFDGIFVQNGSPMSKERDENGKRYALRYAVLPTVATWLLIALTFILPAIDSTRPPYIDLAGSVAEIAYWIAWSGSNVGAPVLALIMILAFVGLRPINAAARCKEALIIAFVATAFAGGGATLNENILKTDLKVPRPNVVLLARENGTGPLGMTAEQFYRIDTSASRSEAMADALALKSMPMPVGPLVASHWIEETGYSFPSGHAFAAMLIASLFLALAASNLPAGNPGFFYLLLPWALAVCYSRTILRVHTPTDITIGGVQGIVAGLVAWLLVRKLLRRFPSRTAG
jgi:phosphatidylglycerophosphatase B